MKELILLILFAAVIIVIARLLLAIVCPSWVGRKKNLNNFRTEAATHPGFAPLES